MSLAIHNCSVRLCGPYKDENLNKQGSPIDASKGVRTTLIAAAVIAGLGAILGALVYFGVISVGAGAGTGALTTLTQNHAFWLMIAGGATLLTSTVLAIIQKGVMHHRSKTDFS